VTGTDPLAPAAAVAAARDRAEDLLALLCEFVATPSPTPPGDTRAVADLLRDRLDARGIDHETLAASPERPNVVASFDGTGGPPEDGPHLAFNGHLDTYEVGERDRWTRDPVSGAVEDGWIHGRGVSDMHAGFVATLGAFEHLHDHRDAFAGRVSLLAASDEEDGGRLGTEHVLAARPALAGDAVLNGEPSAGLVRFGERGPLWLDVEVEGHAAHAALPEGTSATAALVEFLHDLRADPGLDALVDVPDAVRERVLAGADEVDARYGEGACARALEPSVSVGHLAGGGTINRTAERASAAVDVRLPVGTDPDDAVAWARSVAADRPATVTVEPRIVHEPTYTDPDHPLVRTVGAVAARVRGLDAPPAASVGHGFTDLRFYRARGVPAVYYGPRPHGMAGPDERVAVSEFVESVAVHTATAAAVVAGRVTL
jgi:succinyl-diaminopimelate desuccinylase